MNGNFDEEYENIHDYSGMDWRVIKSEEAYDGQYCNLHMEEYQEPYYEPYEETYSALDTVTGAESYYSGPYHETEETQYYMDAMTVNNEQEEVQPQNNTKEKKKKDSFGRRAGRLIAGGLLFGLVAGVTFQGVNYGADQLFHKEERLTEEVMATSDSVQTQPLANVEGNATPTLVYDVSDVAAKVQPSIVSITTTVVTQYQYFYQEYEQYQNGAGSGIIIGKSENTLYIATNYHVVKGAEEINVGFVDGEVVKATVKGYDEDADIAVCEVQFSDMKASTAEVITIAEIGDSSNLTVGEPAIAIGNALGYGQSVTVGYISALDRIIQDTEGTFIQTDAAINPGNSGGALIDINGRVIGINSVKYVDSKVEGMGFAIPINDAMDIINDIIDGRGRVYIGIAGVDVTKEYSQIYGFPEGIYVKEVLTDSPAEAAGIHVGDIIVEFDGKSVYTMEELSAMVKEKEKGDKVRVVIYRTNSMGQYKQMKFEVILDEGLLE